MRRLRKTKRLKFSKLLKARVLKINYVLTKRTLRKMTNKGREVNYGLMKVGHKLTSSYYKFLFPSLYFSHFVTNNILASVFPSLVIAKGTTPTPRYRLESGGVIPILGKSIQSTIPTTVTNLTPGLKL